jgi:signal transduction histidine kinase
MHVARGLARFDRGHPMPLDCVFALAVLAFGLSDLAVGRAHHVPVTLLVATVVGAALPLAWRRRAPRIVLAAVLACTVVQWSAGVSLHSSMSVLLALYAVARHDRLTVLPLAAAGTAAGMVVAAFHALPFAHEPWNSLFFLYASATAAAALGLVVRLRQAQLSAFADRAARLEVEREQRVQLATLAERSRVSREMHDIVGHNLAIIVGLADGGAASSAANGSADVLRMIADTGRQALTELRRTLGALRERPGQQAETVELSPQPGIADIAALLDRIRAAGPDVSYQAEGDIDTLPPSVQLAVYRVVQEALTNSLKHAGPATRLHVVLRTTDDDVELCVQDSGSTPHRPADRAADERREYRGVGLIGIRERVALAGGNAYAGPADDGGWIVNAVLPRPAAKEPIA